MRHAASRRPNVLLFTTDQQRGDHVGISGHPIVETPNVDSFVDHGAYFPNAYTEIPSTTGARRCLLAGQGSHECGLVGYAAVEWHERNTLPQILADAGYHCINVGFRNLHPARKRYGFHTVIPHDDGEGDRDYRAWLTAQLGPTVNEQGHGLDANGWAARPWHLADRYHPTNWTTDTALDQIRKRDPTRPFLLWVSHSRPHSPYDPPRCFWDMYTNAELPEVPVGDWAAKHDVPNSGLARNAWRGHLTPLQSQRARAAYLGLCTHLDYELGRMVEELAGLGLFDDTLVIFTSDHGDMLGDHHLHRKTYAYEGSARIPFLVRYPRGLDLPNGVFEEVVGLQDVMPTVLEAVGVAIPDSVTGRSVFGAARREPWREFIHGEHAPCYSLDEAMHYLTDGREKYIWFPANDEEQFFDLERDRSEIYDLAGRPEHADRVAPWRQRLIELLAGRGDGFSDGSKLLTKPDGWSAEAR